MLSLQLVHTIFSAYYLILLARVIFSWLRVSAPSPLLLRLRGFTYDATEPLLRPIRRVLAPYQRQAPVDFSPLILFIALRIAAEIIVRLLGLY